MKVLHCLDVLNIGGIQEMGLYLHKLDQQNEHAWWVVATGGSFEPILDAHGMRYSLDPTQEKWDVIVGHTVGGWTWDQKFAWAKDRGMYTIEVMHSNADSPTKPELTDLFVGVSRIATLKNHERFKTVTTIYPYVPYEVFNARHVIQPRVTVGHLSRLVSEKGVVEFVELARRFPEWDFQLAGRGLLEKQLEIAAPPNVKFLGWVRDFASFYCGLDLYLYPSRDECSCVSVAMAQAAMVPVVCQDLPALRESTGGHAVFANTLEQFEKAMREPFLARGLWRVQDGWTWVAQEFNDPFISSWQKAIQGGCHETA